MEDLGRYFQILAALIGFVVLIAFEVIALATLTQAFVIFYKNMFTKPPGGDTKPKEKV